MKKFHQTASKQQQVSLTELESDWERGQESLVRQSGHQENKPKTTKLDARGYNLQSDVDMNLETSYFIKKTISFSLNTWPLCTITSSSSCVSWWLSCDLWVPAALSPAALCQTRELQRAATVCNWTLESEAQTSFCAEETLQFYFISFQETAERFQRKSIS